MVEKPDDEKEMSMEEILSSIRKYVTDEKGPAAISTPSPQTPTGISAEFYDEDVIELTHSLDKPSSLEEKVLREKASPPVASSFTPAAVTPITATTGRQNPIAASPSTLETPLPSPKVVASSSPTAQAANTVASPPPAPIKHAPFQSAQYPFSTLSSPQQPSNNADSLASQHTVAAATQSFSRLTEATHQPASKPLLTGDTTIEQLINQITKPIIKMWLDQNLAPLVESMVAKEIERISRR